MGVLLLLLLICWLPGAQAETIREDNSILQQEVGSPLYLWRDPAVSQPRAILIAVHGSAQEGAVMDALARTLVPKGFVVVAPDVRGNGRAQQAVSFSAPPTADVQLTQTCGDVSKALNILSQTFPEADIFCLGESIGAGVVLRAVSSNPKNVRGVILVSAGVKPHMHNPLNLGGNFIKGMATLVQPVDLTNYITRYCSEDPRVVQEMLSDPLAKNRQTGLDLIGTFAFLRQEPFYAKAMPKNIPVLAIQGSADQIVDPASVEELLSALPSKSKKLVTIDGCGHVIVGTSFLKPQVLASIDSFLDKNAKNLRKTTKQVREKIAKGDGARSKKPNHPSAKSKNTAAQSAASGATTSNTSGPQINSTASHGLIDPADFSGQTSAGQAAANPASAALNNAVTAPSVAVPDSTQGTASSATRGLVSPADFGGAPTSNAAASTAGSNSAPGATNPARGLISPSDFAQTPASSQSEEKAKSDK